MHYIYLSQLYGRCELRKYTFFPFFKVKLEKAVFKLDGEDRLVVKDIQADLLFFLA